MENTMMGPYHWDSANHLDGNSALSMPTPVTAWVYPACRWAGIPPVHFASSKNAQAAAFTSHWNLRRCSVHSHRRTHAHWHVSCIITHAANGPCTGLMKHEKWQLRWMSVRFFFSAGANKKKKKYFIRYDYSDKRFQSPFFWNSSSQICGWRTLQRKKRFKELLKNMSTKAF